MVDTEICQELQTTSYLKAIPFEPDPWLSEALESIETSISALIGMVQDIHQSAALTSVEETRLRLERLESFFTDPRRHPEDVLEKLLRQKDLGMQKMHSHCQFVNIGDVESLDADSTEDSNRVDLFCSDLMADRVDSTVTLEKTGISLLTPEAELMPQRLSAATYGCTGAPDKSLCAAKDSSSPLVDIKNMEQLDAECVRTEDFNRVDLASSDFIADTMVTPAKAETLFFSPAAELAPERLTEATDRSTAAPNESLSVNAAEDSTLSLSCAVPCLQPVPVASLHESNTDSTLDTINFVAIQTGADDGIPCPLAPCLSHQDDAGGAEEAAQSTEFVAKQHAPVHQPQQIHKRLELELSAEGRHVLFDHISSSPTSAATTTSASLAGILSSSAGMLPCRQDEAANSSRMETQPSAHEHLGGVENSGTEVSPPQFRPHNTELGKTGHTQHEANSIIRCLSQHEVDDIFRTPSAANNFSAPSTRKNTMTVHQAQASQMQDSLATKLAVSTDGTDVARSATCDRTAQGHEFDPIGANRRAPNTEVLELSSPSMWDCDDATDSFSETPTTVLSSSHDQGYMADEVSTSYNGKMKTIRNPFRRLTQKLQAHSPSVPRIPQFRPHSACGGSSACADEQVPLLLYRPASAPEVRPGEPWQRPQKVARSQQNSQPSRFSETSGMLFGLGLLSQVTYRSSDESGKSKALYSMPNRRRK
eukprot:TRINITY_DN103617_c0_g1_i1.p1 TRINITY_DN103617_c0_g1~~TRINITY_DN103617_c0_g1_i1.p1  ORF type:complete len:721 (+),score=95.25 TRINITY_DN103617_c0_g1_i1:43-2163(+)